MKWLLYLSVIIGLSILVVALVGFMLPKAHRATRMAKFKQSPEVIFAAITGPQDWRPGITKVEMPTDGGPRRWREQSSQGSVTFEEAASDPPRLYRSRIADKNLPYSGTWTWEITGTGDGCTCRIIEEGEVYNPVFRIVSQLILGHTKSIDAYLTALGKKFDESVKIEE